MSETVDTKKRFDKKNFLKRLMSAVVLVLLFGSAGILGGWYWYGLVALISLLGLFEFYRVYEIHKNVLGFLGYAASISFLVFEALGRTQLQIVSLVIGFMLIMTAYVFTYPRNSSTKAMAAAFGPVYIVVMLSYMYRIRIMADGLYLVWLIFAASWGTDVFAYVFGILFGKRKLAPELSPKKSVAGAVGGVLGAAGLGAVYALIFGRYFSEVQSPVLACAVLSGAAGLISMTGDLLASAFKREHHVKDYSNLIPGHGGILDRFDSVIFVSPVIFYIVYFLPGLRSICRK